MASRRTRIKGIANIPQRKKNTPNVETLTEEKIKLQPDNDGTSALDIKHKEITDLTYKDNKFTDTSSKKQDIDCKSDANSHKTDIEDKSSISSIDKLKVPTNSEINDKSENNISQNLKTIVTENETILKPQEPTDIKPIVRRKFLKPKVNLNFKDNKKKAAVIDDKISEEITEIPSSSNITSSNCPDNIPKVSDKIIVLSEIRIPVIQQVAVPVIPQITAPNNDEKPISETAITNSLPNNAELNEGQFSSIDMVQKTSSVVFPQQKRHISESQASDSEYPAPPPSPNKINRSRIKAIPRLSLRKASCSASESEDETRKYGRVRNTSVCSVASTTCLEQPTATSEIVPTKEIPPQPKKLIKTEQSKKLAEAKKEFYKRFGSNMPDKQRLKMIDLIYYNPVTNPMSQKPSNNKSETDKEIKENNIEEQEVDDPVNEEEQKENDSDNNMPVPQIKIGPSGEIILDEQSLIIENAELAKQKEKISNSQIVDGDFDTSYGIYKRAHRSISWSQKETLRFYKALNLIGTDFSVMTQLFPKRTRRELKLKFKKEEKINRHLVDKAIMQPCSYNFVDLKREVQVEEEEEIFLKKLEREELEKQRQEKKQKKERKTKSKGSNEIVEVASIEVAETDESNAANKLCTQSIKSKNLKQRKRKNKSLSINSVIDESEDDADISDITQSDTDEEEIIPFLKPTRSGRMPKSTIKFVDPPEEICKLSRKKIYKKNETNKHKAVINSQVTLSSAPRNRRFSSTSSVESNSEKLVPGSVVITSEEGPNNEFEYKVFMVTPEKKLVPLQLDSDVIEKLIKEKQSAELPLSPERNITIPASETNEC